MTDRARQAILEAATATLPGNSGASLADVAAAAGLGRTTVHRHFATREALLAAVAIAAIDRLDAAVAQCHLDEVPAPEALRRVAEALIPRSHEFRFLSVGPEVWKLHELIERWYRLADRLEAVVDRGKADGDIRLDLPTAWLVDLFSQGLVAAGDSIDDGRIARNDAPRLLVEVLLNGAGR